MSEVVRFDTYLEDREIKPGHLRCAHCKGKTACNCSTCGTVMIREEIETKNIRNEKAGGFDPMYKDVLVPTKKQYTEYGICKVCNGMGQVYDAEEDARYKKAVADTEAAAEQKRQNEEETVRFYGKVLIVAVAILLMVGVGCIIYDNLPAIKQLLQSKTF